MLIFLALSVLKPLAQSLKTAPPNKPMFGDSVRSSQISRQQGSRELVEATWQLPPERS
jgi:hypothetical protein